jgi:hypothetical protein
MPKSRPPYPPEYRRRMVEMVRSGMSPEAPGSEVRADGAGDPELGSPGRARRGKAPGRRDERRAGGASGPACFVGGASRRRCFPTTLRDRAAWAAPDLVQRNFGPPVPLGSGSPTSRMSRPTLGCCTIINRSNNGQQCSQSTQKDSKSAADLTGTTWKWHSGECKKEDC